MTRVYRRKESIPERFLSKIDKKGAKIPHMKTRCWHWTGSLDGGRYGMFRVTSKTHRAHRVSWIFANHRKIPKGMVVMHLCDVPFCVRPSHLQLGTYRENTQDSIKKGRFNTSVMLSGEDNPAAKLSNEDVRHIREFYAQGYKQKLLAEEYDVSRRNISYIVNFQSRKKG